mmetsp:Transcript_2973/g.4599  ORF Transcript_2973/g.4599 Transcript_2973/m.4599 type:complete len:97 (-) Transcript_2973:1218-1508(-)
MTNPTQGLVTLILSTILWASASAKDYKFLVLNDIHLLVNFSDPASLFTESKLGNYTDMGIFGLDAPLELVKYVINRSKKELKGEKLDAVLVSGDYI